MLNKNHIDAFNRDGFILIRDVLMAKDLEVVQQPAGEILSVGCPLPLDERILGIAKALLGDRIVYFGSSSFYHREFKPHPFIQGRHLHHDAKGSPENIFNRRHDALDYTYPVLRIAAYLEDYETHSGGLKVAPGSHKRQTYTFDEDLTYFNVPARLGDIVAFCHRTLHSPYALRIEDVPDKAIHPWLEDKMSVKFPAKCVPHHLKRRAIFMDFAKPSEEADFFIKNRAMHASSVKNNINSHYDSSNVLDAARDREVELRFDGLIYGLSHMAVKRKQKGADSDALRERIRKLCDLNEEYSRHFPLTNPNPEQLIEEANVYLGEMAKNKSSDPHMGGSGVSLNASK